MSKFFFRAVLAVICILCFFSGYLGYRYGAVNYYYGLPDKQAFTVGLRMLDSNFRFYNGLWFGIGIVLAWMIPHATRKTHCMWCLSVLFFMGGIGRIVSLVTCGIPSIMYLLFLPFEIGFPLLALWQHQLSLKS